MAPQTRPKNKKARPAAPVMSDAAKVKAGIVPAKPRAKRVTKDATIRELRERIAQLENPDDPHPSKEPLVRTSLLILCAYGLTQYLSFITAEVLEATSLRLTLTLTVTVTPPLPLVGNAPDKPTTNGTLRLNVQLRMCTYGQLQGIETHENVQVV